MKCLICRDMVDKSDLPEHIYWHYGTSDERIVLRAVTKYLVALQKKIEEDL